MQSFALPSKEKFHQFSRDGDQEQVCRLSPQGHHFIPYPGHYSPAFAFCSILYPLTHEHSLWSACLSSDRRVVGLTSFRCCNTTGLGLVSPPCALDVRAIQLINGLARACHVGLSLSALFGSSSLMTFINDSRELTLPVSLALFRVKLPELLRISRRYLQPSCDVQYIVSRASHPAITHDARRDRLLPTERKVHLISSIGLPLEQLQQRLYESHYKLCSDLTHSVRS